MPYQSEEDLCKFLDRIEEEAQGAKGDLDRRMRENLDIARGKQWKGNTSPVFLNNIIETCLEEKVGKLSESKPKISVLPTVNGLDGAAEVLRQTTKSIWDKSKMEYKTERLGMYGSLAGVGFVGTPFNRRLNYGQGDIDIVVKDPRACGVDLAVVSAEDADLGEYVVMEDFVPLDIVRSDYPVRGALVKPDEKISGYDQAKPQTTREMIRGVYDRIFKKKESEVHSAIPKCVLKEYYIQDRRKHIDELGVVPCVEHLTKPSMDEKGNNPFPGGRRIIRAGNIILEDSYNPYWDGLYPIDMLSWKIDLETAWAADEVQSVKRMQETLNRTGDAYAKSILINAVIRLIMDEGALSPEERNKLSNEIGQIIVKAPGRDLDFAVPPVLPADVPNWVQVLAEMIRQKIGVTQPPTQKRVPSIITGPAIEGLQLMVETPIRTAARRIEEFYQRVGQKIISRVFQYYTSNRLIHLVGPSEQWIKFEFERSKLIRDAKGNPRTEQDLRRAYQDFNFYIEPGSSLAITRTQRALMKANLAQMGWLHPKEILEELGIDNALEKLKDAAKAKEDGFFDAIFGKGGRSSNIGALPSGNGDLMNAA